MTTQKDLKETILTQLTGIIEKYGISQINDKCFDSNPHHFSLSRCAGDLRSVVTFTQDASGDFTQLKIQLSDNLKITPEIKALCGYDFDFYESIGDENDMYSFIVFNLYDVNTKISLVENRIKHYKTELGRAFLRPSLKQELTENLKAGQTELEKLQKRRSKKTYHVSNHSLLLTANTAGPLFRKLIRIAEKNMRDWDSSIANNPSFIKRAIAI